MEQAEQYHEPNFDQLSYSEQLKLKDRLDIMYWEAQELLANIVQERAELMNLMQAQAISQPQNNDYA